MGRSLATPALCLAWLALAAACGAPPPPVTPVESAPARPPTLGIAFDYAPELVLIVRLDGRPIEGKVELIGEVPDLTQIPADPTTIPMKFSDHQVWFTAQDGKVKLEAQQSRELATYPRHRLRAGGVDVPLPRLGTHDPFACANALADARLPDACTSSPLAVDPPPSCDSRGAEVWRALASARQETFEHCWEKADLATATQLEATKDAAVRHLACQAIAARHGETLDDDFGGRIYPICESLLPVQSRGRLRLAWRRQTLPAALAQAERGTFRELQAFYRDFSITGDPRVEQIRALAAQRFGPPDVTIFRSLKTSLEKMVSFHGHHVALCEIGPLYAEYAIINPPPRQDPKQRRRPVDHGTDYYTSPIVYLPTPPPPASYLNQIAATLKFRAKVKEVHVADHCNQDRYWYLVEPPAH
jgi:hypothetical protein